MKRTQDAKIISHTEDRSTLWHALTPQFFPAQRLKKALSEAFAANAVVTDEASAMEFLGSIRNWLRAELIISKLPAPKI